MLLKYKNYKDSGVEWIGEIPEGWEVKKLKYVAKINPTKDSSIDSSSLEPVTFLPMERVGENGEIDCELRKPIKDLWSGFTYFKKNDVIIAKITPCFENGKGALLNDLETEFGFGSTEFHVLRANSNTYAGFLFYLTKSEIFMKVGEAFMTGAAGQKRVPTGFISEFAFSVPTLPEQTAIASFLDRKTAEIEQLIANKEKLIALYEEEKTAIINRAVTRGLDPNVTTKPSGVDWLEDIPEHWEVKRFKYLGKFINGYSFNSTDFTSYGVRVMKISNIQTMKLDWADESFVEESFFDRYKAFRVQENDLVFALTRPIISTGIKAAIVDSNERILLNQRNSMFKVAEKVQTRWMYFLILSSQFVQEFDKQIDKTGQQPNISSNDIAEISVPVPALSEQNEIITHIEAECSRLDTLIEKFKKQIDLFKEYRTTLISEVVTGKIDVRGEVAT